MLHRELQKAGLLIPMFPELEGLDNVPQDPRHHPEGDVLTHTLLVADYVPQTLEFFLAAIIHDIGKKDTTLVTAEKITAHGHDKVSVEYGEKILSRLKVPTALKSTVLFLVEHHMKAHSPNTVRKTLRKLINKGGLDLVEKLVVFGYADVRAGSKDFTDVTRIDKTLQEIKAAPVPVVTKPLLNGEEVMRITGLPSGKELGKIIKNLVDAQMDNETMTKAEAEEFVKCQMSYMQSTQ